MIDKKLLDILVCPNCKGDVYYDSSNSRLICKACKLAYPVRDGIPILLIDQAEGTED